MPANQDDTPTPLSRYSSSENVLRLDGGSNSASSVAEKTMMFELTANIKNNRNSSSPKPKTNGNSDGQRSPRFSSSPRRNNIQENKKQTNENNTSNKNLSNGDDKSSNFQDLLTQQLLANKSWSEIMDTES